MSQNTKSSGRMAETTLNDNGGRLHVILSFADDYELAIVNTLFSTPKIGTSQLSFETFRLCISSRGNETDRQLVRNVTVHPQPAFLPTSDDNDNVVSKDVRLLGRSPLNRKP